MRTPCCFWPRGRLDSLPDVIPFGKRMSGKELHVKVKAYKLPL